MNAQGTQLSLFETRSSNDPFAVRVSPRARRLTARVHVGGRVEIVVPVGVSPKTVRDFVQRFTPWIDRKVAAMQCHPEPAAAVPQAVEFALTNERFDVEWQATAKRGVTQQGGRLMVYAPDDVAARLLLQGWLKRAATERLAPGLLQLARDLNYSVTARGHPLPTHAVGQLLDARYGEFELLAGVSAARGGAVSVRA